MDEFEHQMDLLEAKSRAGTFGFVAALLIAGLVFLAGYTASSVNTAQGCRKQGGFTAYGAAFTCAEHEFKPLR